MKQTTERHSPIGSDDRGEGDRCDAQVRISLVREYARPKDRLLEIGSAKGTARRSSGLGQEYVGVEVEDDAVAHAVDDIHNRSRLSRLEGETLAFGGSSSTS